MQENLGQKYQIWLEKASLDPDLFAELQAMDEAQIEDAFYRELTFGTGGLRGVIGAGTNRMNVYTVAKTSQGLADYVKKHFAPQARKIAISCDSSIKSDLFARVAAEVFAANGITVYQYRELMPTPCLSYAVRKLGCAAGIMITASHNPAQYNGYKVYGADGCQITTQAAADISHEIEKLDIFCDIKRIPFEEGLKQGDIHWIDEKVYTSFLNEVKAQSVLGKETIDKSVSIVYTPLNGTGLKPVLRVLRESRFDNVSVVAEQEQPDGHFPTCPFPNPEIREAMALGIKYAQSKGADLLLATDPDCDRVGIAVRNAAGEFVLLMWKRNRHTFEGSSGFEKMQEIMKTLRQGVNSIGGKPVEVCLDYATGLDNLPKSNVLKYLLAGKASVVVRPSGTEPKLKIYISVSSKNREEAQAAEALIYSDLTDRMNAFRHK